ncbi:MAG TPA: pyridoxal phosphate-dependent aminotransferase [Candidatus Eisenbacteria bacterium]|nr:pyridoxal phosphate-dependent aminotransferase [Candidatus Eisenbacteria bacterium]
MNVSTRGKEAQASPIRRLAPYAEAAMKEGTKVYQLNIGQPDLPTPDIVMERIRNYPGTYVPYSPSPGTAEFREGMSRYYQAHGLDFSPAEILTTVGGSEALQFAFWALFEPGDEVIIFEPFYTNYATMALLAGVHVKPIACDGRTGYHLPPIEAIERVIGPKTRGILICAPSNPTGTAYSAAEIDGIVDLAKSKGLWLITDEAYREFVYDGLKHESPLTRKGVDQQVVLVDSISKRLNMCGARVGTLVTKNAAVREACLKFAQARLSPPTIGQHAAAVLDKVPASYTKMVVDEFRKRRDLVLEGLAKIPGTFARKPEGAFYLMAELPVANAEEFVIWMLKEYRKDKATVMVAPGDGFYATPGRGKNEIRFAYVLEEGALRKAMEILAGALEAYPVKVGR